jgi:hypothetical protein
MMPAKTAIARPLMKEKVALAGGGLLFGRHLALFARARRPAHTDGNQRKHDAHQRHLPGPLMRNGVPLAVVDRRNNGAESGAEPERNRITQPQSEVADGETEGQTSHAPQQAPEHRPEDIASGREARGVQDVKRMRHEDQRQHRRRDQPRGHALDDPVDLPRPALDAAEGDEVRGGAEAADPMKDDA